MKPEIGEALYELKNHGRRITLLSFSEQPSDPIQGFGCTIYRSALNLNLSYDILGEEFLPSIIWRPWREVAILAMMVMELCWMDPGFDR
jgi:hypothetical protein